MSGSHDRHGTPVRIALPTALRRWWRGQPRLALADAPAAQLASLAAIAPVERLLVIGPDAAPLAALIADSAELEPTPIAALPPAHPAGAQSEADNVDILHAEPHRLPLPDAAVDTAVIPHQLRRWDDEQVRQVLEELWRVLAHNGVAILWEVAPSRSARLNAVWSTLLREQDRPPKLRSFAQVGQLAYDAGFAWIQTLPLRPFLLPPGPRLTVLARKEHYTAENIGRG